MKALTSNTPRIGFARDAARTLLKKLSIDSPPVLLRDVASQIPNLYIDGAELDDSLSGVQITYEGKPFIRYNKGHSVKRSRFTVAHEIGHLVLGHTSNCNNTRYDNPTNVYETEANQFAAELLMPLTILRKEIQPQDTAETLAKKFWVSKESMNWRLLETKLYKKLRSW